MTASSEYADRPMLAAAHRLSGFVLAKMPAFATGILLPFG